MLGKIGNYLYVLSIIVLFYLCYSSKHQGGALAAAARKNKINSPLHFSGEHVFTHTVFILIGLDFPLLAEGARCCMSYRLQREVLIEKSIPRDGRRGADPRLKYNE